MSSKVSSIMSSKLYTEEEVNFERAFEIRIRDLRERKGDKQKSFSLYVKPGTEEDEYPSLNEIRVLLNKIIENRIKV